jgi:hypothetical protein
LEERRGKEYWISTPVKPAKKMGPTYMPLPTRTVTGSFAGPNSHVEAQPETPKINWVRHEEKSALARSKPQYLIAAE